MHLLIDKKYGQDEYDFSIRETQTYEIIEDVAKMNSELGIILWMILMMSFLIKF